MVKLSKKLINEKLTPYLSEGKRGPKCQYGLWRIVRAIIHKLKTGCQWRELPLRQFFNRFSITWNTVYYYFQKWSKDGSWYRLWTSFLKLHKSLLDMSSVQLDGSHTPAKRGGENVGYQGRKKSKTTNMLFLTEKQGIPLGCSDPVAGNHNDLFEIKKSVSKIVDTLKASNIDYDGLFMNADAGFDGVEFRELCEYLGIIPNFDINKRNSKNPDKHDYYFDCQLYKERFVVERTNAWLDGYKGLLIRYETKASHWLSFHYLAFTLILLRKVSNTELKL
jgi:transposase